MLESFCHERNKFRITSYNVCYTKLLRIDPADILCPDKAGEVRLCNLNTVFAIAEASGESIREIVSACKAANLTHKILPPMTEILDWKRGIKSLREVIV